MILWNTMIFMIKTEKSQFKKEKSPRHSFLSWFSSHYFLNEFVTFFVSKKLFVLDLIPPLVFPCIVISYYFYLVTNVIDKLHNYNYH